jgi:hypothetical protein
MAVTFVISVDKSSSIEETIANKYGNQDFVVISSREYETVTYYTIESFYGATFNPRIEYGGFDRDMPYMMITCKAANGEFVHVCVNSVANGWKEEYQYSVDAPESIQQEYTNLVEYKKRKVNVEKLWNQRKELIEISKEIGAPSYHVVKKLKMASDAYSDFYEVIKLLKSFKKGTIRSTFRMSLASQIFNWMNDPAPRFNSPLSPKQFGYIRPYKPY